MTLVTYYSSTEINNVRYSNLNLDFTYAPVPKEFLDSSFEKWLGNTQFYTVDELGVTNDVVTWSAIRSLNNKILARKKVRTKATKTVFFFN
nr:hypothetical protein [Mycoplasmopsis bovis]